jgi:hypothetical protein
MADVEIHGADVADGRVRTLTVRFKNAATHTIDRETALRWLADGHALVTYAGPAHHGTRGHSVVAVEVDDASYLRTDTQPVAEDSLTFPHAH